MVSDTRRGGTDKMRFVGCESGGGQNGAPVNGHRGSSLAFVIKRRWSRIHRGERREKSEEGRE
jgi:hypothetical protein